MLYLRILFSTNLRRFFKVREEENSTNSATHQIVHILPSRYEAYLNEEERCSDGNVRHEVAQLA